MKKLCKQYGCNLQNQKEYSDAIVQICEDCGKKYVFNKVDGSIDTDKYRIANKRALIQPSDKRAWAEVYGTELLEKGKVKFRTEMSDEERKDEEKYQKEQASMQEDYLKDQIVTKFY